MADYLMREEAPLSEKEWARVDELVAKVAQRRLVGRRILPLFGPLGAAVQTVPVDTFAGVGPEASGEPVRQEGRAFVPLAQIAKDFILRWQDVEQGRAGVMPTELSPAAAAAAACAMAEDRLIFRGDPDGGAPGLMTVEGRVHIPMSDWEKDGAFGDVTAAIRALQEHGCPGPYALVVSPAGYARMQRPYANTGALEIALVRELASDGVYQSPILGEHEALLIATGAQNADLAVGVDLSVAYLGPEEMDHRFRVFETVALRIKRPEALCTIAR